MMATAMPARRAARGAMRRSQREPVEVSSAPAAAALPPRRARRHLPSPRRAKNPLSRACPKAAFTVSCARARCGSINVVPHPITACRPGTSCACRRCHRHRVEHAAPERFAWLADRIIYEDEHLLVVDKPAGLAVHAGSGVVFGLIEGLRALRPEAPMLELAHRLDRDTSGCLLIARAGRRYLGCTRRLRPVVSQSATSRWCGAVAWPPADHHCGAERHERGGERMVEAGDEGKAAASVFHPRTRYTEAGATLVEVELLTGRTHQARVHAAHAGHPIAGDDKYGDREFNRELRAIGLKRLFLHAWRLNFKHPLTNSKMALEAPLAPELSALLERLNHAPPV